MSKSSDEEKEKFLAWVEWLPVTSRTHVTHSLTDKCKISIMIEFVTIFSLGLNFMVPGYMPSSPRQSL